MRAALIALAVIIACAAVNAQLLTTGVGPGGFSTSSSGGGGGGGCQGKLDLSTGCITGVPIP